MDAALDVIVRDGYGGVSVEAIVREVDVTRPVFYNVFASLDELLSVLLDRQERRALDQLTSTISVPGLGGDLSAYLHSTVRSLVRMVADDPRTWKPIFLAAVDTPPAARERIARDRESIRARFAMLLSLALGSDHDLDVELLAHALIAIGEYFGRMILEDPSSVDPDRLADTIGVLVPLR